MNRLELIQNKVFEIRRQRVMFDFHLAETYEIETQTLKQIVRSYSDEYFDPNPSVEKIITY
jgi:hypothetical protein